MLKAKDKLTRWRMGVALILAVASATAYAAPEIKVQQLSPELGAVDVEEAGFSDFPDTELGDSLALFYSIENIGDEDIEFTTDPVVQVIAGVSGFDALTQPNGFPIPPGFSTTFRITYGPFLAGPRTARVFIFSNATNTAGPFDFTLRGTGVEVVDCNENGVDDTADIDAGDSLDCNVNGVPDECELIEGTTIDCNGNGALDECDLADGTSVDCNANSAPDECDLVDATSEDCDEDGTPDECELDSDGDGVIDDCELDDVIDDPIDDPIDDVVEDPADQQDEVIDNQNDNANEDPDQDVDNQNANENDNVVEDDPGNHNGNNEDGGHVDNAHDNDGGRVSAPCGAGGVGMVFMSLAGLLGLRLHGYRSPRRA